MNKVIFIFNLLFLVYFSNSQVTEKFDTQKKLIEYLNDKICNEPFSINLKYNEEDSVELIKNKGDLFFKFSNKYFNNIIRSNGKIILNINFSNEEIEIYELTKKEQENCFFTSMFLKEFKFENFNNDLTTKKASIIASQKKSNYLIKITLDYKNSESKISFLIGENINGNNEWIKKTNFNFYEESEFKELYKSFFLDEIFNTYKLKERYKDWEIIDFR